MSSLNAVLGPLVLISAIRDVGETLDYLQSHPIQGAIILVLISSVFAVYLKRQGRAKSERIPTKTATVRPLSVVRSRVLLRVAGIGVAIVGLVGTVAAFVAIYVSGLHYVQIASAKGKEAAIQEIQSINQFLKRNEIDELEAHALASSTGTGWYMITIGRGHLTRTGAEKTLRRARSLLGNQMRSDARIYATSEVSVIARLRGLLGTLMPPSCTCYGHIEASHT